MQFEITLKNEKIKYYKFIALLLLVLNLAVFIFLLLTGVHLYETVASLLLAGLHIMYLIYEAKRNSEAFFIRRSTFLILACSWIVLQNYLPALACVALGVLYHLSLQKLQFVFNDNFIAKTNFPQKEYSWEAIDNIILRDHMLTIDLKNNRLIQFETESSVNEIQFNEFAQQHLYKIPLP
jgi:hypothetical protein